MRHWDPLIRTYLFKYRIIFAFDFFLNKPLTNTNTITSMCVVVYVVYIKFYKILLFCEKKNKKFQHHQSCSHVRKCNLRIFTMILQLKVFVMIIYESALVHISNTSMYSGVLVISILFFWGNFYQFFSQKFYRNFGFYHGQRQIANINSKFQVFICFMELYALHAFVAVLIFVVLQVPKITFNFSMSSGDGHISNDLRYFFFLWRK